MKKMIIAAVALLASTFAVQAQGVHPRLEVAGNFSTNIVKDASGYSVKDYRTRPGFRVAGAVEVDLLGPLYIAPGVAFQQNGSKLGDQTTTLNYLSVPVNLGLRLGLGGLAVSLEGGPSFSYGSTAKDVLLDFQNGGLKRFETGVNASVAVHLSSLYFRLGSDIGLTNIYKQKASEASLKNASFYFGVGLRF